jgi:hypothetical protein
MWVEEKGFGSLKIGVRSEKLNGTFVISYLWQSEL